MSSHQARTCAVLPLTVATPRTCKVGEIVQKNGALATTNANAFGVTTTIESTSEIHVAVIGGVAGTVNLIASVAIAFGDRITAAAAGETAVATTAAIGFCVDSRGAAADELYEAVIHPIVALS